MKKWGIVGLIALVTIVSATVTSAAEKFTLIVNGQVANVEPVVIKGTTYIPVRAAAELLGADVKYDASTRTVTITGKDAVQQENAKGGFVEFDVDIDVEQGPMKMNISKVTLDPAYKEYEFSDPQPVIILNVKVENTSDEKLNWYVNQSQLVLNTKEQIENTKTTRDYISSEFNGKVIKEGTIVFPTKSNLDEISSMRLLLKYVIDENWNTVAEDKEIEIILR